MTVLIILGLVFSYVTVGMIVSLATNHVYRLNQRIAYAHNGMSSWGHGPNKDARDGGSAAAGVFWPLALPMVIVTYLYAKIKYHDALKLYYEYIKVSEKDNLADARYAVAEARRLRIAKLERELEDAQRYGEIKPAHQTYFDKLAAKKMAS